MKPVFIFLFFCFASSIACRNEGAGLRVLDLKPHGLPITIMAPDSSEVRVKDYTIMKDFTIQQGDGFHVQIFEFTASTNDVAGEKLRQLETVKEDPFFKEIIREDEHGFIYSKQIDSTLVEYDFRYISMLNNKELIFQTGLVGTFSFDEVNRMYNAVKQN